MSDARPEPSMEDILASIKRIIADDSPPPPQRAAVATPAARPPVQSAPPPPIAPQPRFAPAFDRDDRPVLELTDPAPPLTPNPALRPAPAGDRPADRFRQAVAAGQSAAPRIAAAPPATPRETPPPFALSPLAAAPSSGQTVEALVREMLQPMIAQWLSANLSAITERLVREEIARLRDEDDDD